MCRHKVILNPAQDDRYEDCVARIILAVGQLHRIQWVVSAFASLTSKTYDDGICPAMVDRQTQDRPWRPMFTSEDLATLMQRAVNVYDETVFVGFHEPVTIVDLDDSYWYQCDVGFEVIGEWTVFTSTLLQLQEVLRIAPDSVPILLPEPGAE